MCNFFPIVIWATTMSTIVSQSCREYSQSCIDDQACCGGCCIQGICEDIYVDCRLGGHPCSRVLCPPEEECYIYKPKDCQGCGYSTQLRHSPLVAGFCINGICRDTYADCRQGGDPCSGVDCPPDEECYVFQSLDCEGCGPTTQCSTSPPAPQEVPHENKTIGNGSGQAFSEMKLFVVLLIFVMFSN
ncbi:hypothetical protein JTB14_022630 [Gonioctena quinquepunctata]|nr:hypothetical protein JTB14_022630 [Gonioctena quinquepunctata]